MEDDQMEGSTDRRGDAIYSGDSAGFYLQEEEVRQTELIWSDPLFEEARWYNYTGAQEVGQQLF